VLPCADGIEGLIASQELQAFIGDDEFILVSLGTILYLTDSIITRLKTALLRLPYKVLARTAHPSDSIHRSPFIYLFSFFAT
jgi:UDP:flavonoid glycosyltransferase YjiC (YdhE family)